MNRVSMICISGPLAGQVFELDGGPLFIFGRHVKAHVNLPNDPSISQLHFAIDISESRVRVVDIGSVNGLTVNGTLYGGKFGKPANEFVVLNHGDSVMVGNNCFTVEIRSAAEKPWTPPPAWDRPGGVSSGRGETDRLRDGTMLDAGAHAASKTSSETYSAAFPSIKGYTVLGLVGVGGRGAVFKAIRDRTGEKTAVKVIPGRAAKKRHILDVFLREIQINRQLDHPNIIRYVDDGICEGIPYLALEYADGGNLDQFLGGFSGRRMQFAQAVPLFIQILEAAGYMHQMGLVHRDIKPKNILLDLRRSGGLAVKLSDMGLSGRVAKTKDEFMPMTSEGGTPAYMPPEQLTDITKCLPQSDVFSASATVYQMLSGKLLYNFKNKNQATAILDGDIVPLLDLCPDLPGRFVEVINKGLAYYPENRFVDAVAKLAALEAALAG